MKILKLEAIRGFVALYVVIHHFILFTSIYNQTPTILRLFFRFGREAVLIFFLLSGFVICLAIKKRPATGFFEYFQKRALRIYPILLITFLCSTVIFYINGYVFTFDTVKSLLFNILQIQRPINEPGKHINAYLGNLPLWSLSYEWWFYMLFFPFYHLIKKYNSKMKVKDIYIVLLFSTISWTMFLFHPSHIFLIGTFFLLWWTGFYCGEIYFEKKNFEFKDMLHPILSLIIMSAIMGTPILNRIIIHHNSIAQINHNYPITNYVYNYVEAAFLLIIGQLWWNLRLFKFNALFGWFEKLAPISYAIYIIHFPIIQLQIPIINNIYAILTVKFVLIIALSWLLEKRIQPWLMKVHKQIVTKKTETKTTVATIL